MKNAGNASNSASKGMSKLGFSFDMVGRMMDRNAYKNGCF